MRCKHPLLKVTDLSIDLFFRMIQCRRVVIILRYHFSSQCASRSAVILSHAVAEKPRVALFCCQCSAAKQAWKSCHRNNGDDVLWLCMICCTELIITAGGENVPPVLIEDRVKEKLHCVSSCMLVGDKRRFLSMLITLKASNSVNVLLTLAVLLN